MAHSWDGLGVGRPTVLVRVVQLDIGVKQVWHVAALVVLWPLVEKLRVGLLCQALCRQPKAVELFKWRRERERERVRGGNTIEASACKKEPRGKKKSRKQHNAITKGTSTRSSAQPPTSTLRTLESATELLSLQVVRTASSSLSSRCSRATSDCSMLCIVLRLSRAVDDAVSSRDSVSSTIRACSCASILREMASCGGTKRGKKKRGLGAKDEVEE